MTLRSSHSGETTAQEVRPKVYVSDSTGTEWRCVEGKLQSRVEEDDEATGRLEAAFTNGWGGFKSDAEWLSFLKDTYPASLIAANAAIANPMTRDEATADDEAIA